MKNTTKTFIGLGFIKLVILVVILFMNSCNLTSPNNTTSSKESFSKSVKNEQTLQQFVQETFKDIRNKKVYISKNIWNQMDYSVKQQFGAFSAAICAYMVQNNNCCVQIYETNTGLLLAEYSIKKGLETYYNVY